MSDVRRAADELDELCSAATPAPWTAGRGPDTYKAMVSQTKHPDRAGIGWDWDPYYGGCLVAESTMPPDRRLLIALRNAAPHLSALLHALADEDPIRAGEHARRLADVVLTSDPRHPESRRRT